MKWMRGLALFAAGIVVGSMGMQSLIAQQARSTGHKINHVGIRVKDYQQSLDYYTKVLGFKEAYRFPSPNGAPTTTFLQVNKDTFIEMAPPAPDQPAGITHIGLYSDDAAASVRQFRQAGVTLNDAQSSANSGSKLSNLTDPNGIRIEINEQPAGSLMRKAIDAWK
jgi:catechol 2,3-dioxygenase-like lactoylglutathione lyase family enzyme